MKKLICVAIALLMLTSCSKNINCVPEVSSLPDIKQINSSNTSSEDNPIIEKKMPEYTVFENTDWGMTPEEVLTALGLTASDWEELPTDDELSDLQYVIKDTELYGAKVAIVFWFSNNPKRDIGLIQARVVCYDEESNSIIKETLDKKYSKPENREYIWKTDSIALDHPNWDLIEKSMIKETDEINANQPEDRQRSTKGFADCYGKESLASISYIPWENEEAVGFYNFYGYYVAWGNSFE